MLGNHVLNLIVRTLITEFNRSIFSSKKKSYSIKIVKSHWSYFEVNFPLPLLPQYWCAQLLSSKLTKTISYGALASAPVPIGKLHQFSTVTLTWVHLLQRVSIASYAKRCISYDRFCPTVRPTVRHSPVSCQNDSSYDHAVFTGG